MVFLNQFFVLSLVLPSVFSFSSIVGNGKSTTTTAASALKMSSNDDEILQNQISRRTLFQKSTMATGIAFSTVLSTLTTSPMPSNARLDPVDNPSLLPSSPNEVVIQTEKFLTSGQAKRMSDLIVNLERDTGFRLRVLCQNYPNTPGLAIRDYWDLGKEVCVL